MKKRLVMFMLAVAAGPSSVALAQQPAGFWQTPAIQGYGKMHVWPQAILRPDTAATYKALFDVTKGSATDTEVNGALDHVARVVNVFAAAGVPLSHLKFVIVFHGPATPVALSDGAFRARYGHANPNLALIDALTGAGVQVLVCGNALGDMHFAPGEVNSKVQVALAALSTSVILQSQGYAVVQM